MIRDSLFAAAKEAAVRTEVHRGRGHINRIVARTGTQLIVLPRVANTSCVPVPISPDVRCVVFMLFSYVAATERGPLDAPC